MFFLWFFLIHAQHSPGSFHYFKDFPRVLHFIETSHLSEDVPDNMVFKSFQNMVCGVHENYNFIQGTEFDPNWEKVLFQSYGLVVDRLEKIPFVRIVAPGSPADRAGLKQGDMILRVNGAVTYGLCRYEVAKLFSGTPIELEYRPSHVFLPSSKHTIIRGQWTKPEQVLSDCIEVDEDITCVGSIDWANVGRGGMYFPVLVLDMTRNHIGTKGEFLVAVGRLFPQIKQLDRVNRLGKRETLSLDLAVPVSFGKLVLLTDSMVSGWTEMFCHIARHEGALVIGEPTAAFPYQMEWMTIRKSFSMEIASWAYGFVDNEPWKKELEPDYYLPVKNHRQGERLIQAIREIL